MNNRPDFELAPDEHSTLVSNKMLTRAEELVGHTIKAVVEYPGGGFAEAGSILIATETGCWAVFTVDGYSLEDANVGIDSKTITGGVFSNRSLRELTIHDFLSAADMLHEGMIIDAEYQLLRKKEQEAERAAMLEKVERLRHEMAALEGGAL